MSDMTATLNASHNLIASDRVEGTPVFGPEHTRIGTIQTIMIDKKSGQAEYAVMSFGGFLGIGEDFYPIPWRKLTYDLSQGGYVTDINKDMLKDAPRYEREDRPDYDTVYASQVGAYYGF